MRFMRTPEALMNISGKPVTDALHSSAIAPSNMVVIHDSLSHKPQTISPKFGGSANGHNGVRSIIAALRGNMDFHRLRIGIGRDAEVDSAEYVLGPLSSSERQFWGTNGEGTELVWRELSSMTGHMFGPR
ncbi:hypothetical protein AcV5_006882 [Taiwanofungus camphoratus]|nr:hypothetical protein AcV5_006882 [Antrodia cinnamomea]